MYSRTSYAPLDADMVPTGTGSSFATGSARVYDTSRPVEIISTAVLPADSKQLIVRISWTPRIGVVSRARTILRGADYSAPPTFTFDAASGGSHPNKAFPVLRANLSGGKISSITVISGGANLEAVPTFTITGGGGTGATGVCVVPLPSDGDDYLAIERICLGAADKTSLWKREALDVTVARLTHNTYLLDNP